MGRKAAKDKYKEIFNNAPVAIIEMDYSAVRRLGDHLKKLTVTNTRQYLSEHPTLIRKTFRSVKVIDANKAALKLFDATNYKNLLASLGKTFTSTGNDVLIEQFVSLLAGEKEFTGEFKYKKRGRQYREVFLKASVPAEAKNSLDLVVVAIQDITIWKRLERQLRKRAQLDGLTKLLNHSTIMQRLEEELIRAKRYGLSMSCLMIDLDHFKIINDKFGHQRGDQVLKKVAMMIKNCVRKVDVVGRYGGDEFLIILPETRTQNARYAALRVQKIFSSKMFKYQRIISFHISLSIGITGYPSKKVRDSKDLISLADKAMYAAKKSGRNRISTLE